MLKDHKWEPIKKCSPIGGTKNLHKHPKSQLGRQATEKKGKKGTSKLYRLDKSKQANALGQWRLIPQRSVNVPLSSTPPEAPGVREAKERERRIWTETKLFSPSLRWRTDRVEFVFVGKCGRWENFSLFILTRVPKAKWPKEDNPEERGDDEGWGEGQCARKSSL